MQQKRNGLYLALFSIHGLIRSRDLELGRDPDTGGQTKYVIELCEALAADQRVAQVDLFTRQVFGQQVSDDYGKRFEDISPKARIVRLPCGPRRYLRKESLWPYLDIFLDNVFHFFREESAVPDVIHGHYADAGYVGAQLARLLGVPFVFTGHSLGRVKRMRLLADGADEQKIDENYKLPKRIEAEEIALETASLVVASTNQEVREQYELYDHYIPERKKVIAPGVDLRRFSPPKEGAELLSFAGELQRFLDDLERPPVLAIARADRRKNFRALIRAFGESPWLRGNANLILLAGTREKVSEFKGGKREFFQTFFSLIDDYDLYGQVAYPKQHAAKDVAELYRFAAERQGIFVNPALTEPFGLTLLEAAASGLPLVATHDGGPQDIIGACSNGILVDPLNIEEITAAMEKLLQDRSLWQEYAKNGVGFSKELFSWETHVGTYLEALERLLDEREKSSPFRSPVRNRLATIDRMLFSTLDRTLTEGTSTSLESLGAMLQEESRTLGFGVISGRGPESVAQILKTLNLRLPDVCICRSGTEIYYTKHMYPDALWEKHIDFHWQREEIKKTLAEVEGLTLQDKSEQTWAKLSYYLDHEQGVETQDVLRLIRNEKLQANVLETYSGYVDVVPIRASSGLALRYVAFKLGLPLERLLVGDYVLLEKFMLLGNVLGVLSHAEDKQRERHNNPRLFVSEKEHVAALLEAVEHFHFLESIQVPKAQESECRGDTEQTE